MDFINGDFINGFHQWTLGGVEEGRRMTAYNIPFPAGLVHGSYGNSLVRDDAKCGGARPSWDELGKLHGFVGVAEVSR